LLTLYLPKTGNYRIEKQMEETGELFYAMKIGDFVYVVLTSNNYPCFLTAECIDELSSIHAQQESNASRWTLKGKAEKKTVNLRLCVSILTKYSEDEPGCILYDIRKGGYPAEYIDAVNKYVQERKMYEDKVRAEELKQQVCELQAQLAANIHQARENIVDAEALQKLADENLRQSLIFRQNAAEMKLRMARKRRQRVITVALTLTSASVGGIGALAAGGFSDALIVPLVDEALGQLIEMTFGIVVGGASGYSVSVQVTTWFWAQKLVVI
jgi:hypothetical protein